jgi:hypothetical protein
MSITIPRPQEQVFRLYEIHLRHSIETIPDDAIFGEARGFSIFFGDVRTFSGQQTRFLRTLLFPSHRFHR